VGKPVELRDVEVKEGSEVILLPMAAEMVRKLLTEKKRPDGCLRVFVSGGGCSGMQYGMTIESAPGEMDSVFETDGVRVVIDPISMTYLLGATIDYVDNLMGGGFKIDNPNALTSCGCGHSFRTGGTPNAATGGCGHSATSR